MTLVQPSSGIWSGNGECKTELQHKQPNRKGATTMLSHSTHATLLIGGRTASEVCTHMLAVEHSKTCGGYTRLPLELAVQPLEVDVRHRC